MDMNFWFFVGTALGSAGILSICLIIIATSKTYPVIFRSKKEKLFYDPQSGKTIEFPSIAEKPSVSLSVVVPAYNEEDRLPSMLNECLDFLELRSKSIKEFTYEIIVVSDGSTDDTVKKALKYTKKFGPDKVRVLKLEKNRGKGGAVRLGVLSSRGALVLFADADGATKFEDITKLEDSIHKLTKSDYITKPEEIAEKVAISIGSRAHLEEEAVATRTLFRIILMYGFQFLVWLFAVRKIKDTQCGFKLLTRKAAEVCFNSLHVEQWAFDVELLYIVQTLKIPYSEVAVTWTEIDGSKVTPIWSWVQMGMDLAFMWFRYTIGAWKIRYTKTKI